MRKLLIGIVFIIGGLGGGMVLRGTESGIALAVVGLVFCIWGGVEVMSDRKTAVPRGRRVVVSRRPGAAAKRKPGLPGRSLASRRTAPLRPPTRTQPPSEESEPPLAEQ